jgi:hypothetical protein
LVLRTPPAKKAKNDSKLAEFQVRSSLQHFRDGSVSSPPAKKSSPARKKKLAGPQKTTEMPKICTL